MGAGVEMGEGEGVTIGACVVTGVGLAGDVVAAGDDVLPGMHCQ